MRSKPFSRPTLIAAVESLGPLTQARFNQLVLRIRLEEEINSDTAVSVAKKCDILGRVVVQRTEKALDTLEGHMTLGEAVVREAVRLTEPDSEKPLQVAFERGLARDGYVIALAEDGAPLLRAALPDEIQLTETDDEVHELLEHFGFAIPKGHLDQAIEAHTRGDWAACNGQPRTFMEGLFDDIARHARPLEAAQLATAQNRRALLAEIEFLVVDRKEWTNDGKNYVNGLFQMLHTEGSHPGLSDEDHSTFRLHIVLVTARTFLRRLRYGR
jgi:hypothetical protein